MLHYGAQQSGVEPCAERALHNPCLAALPAQPPALPAQQPALKEASRSAVLPIGWNPCLAALPAQQPALPPALPAQQPALPAFLSCQLGCSQCASGTWGLPARPPISYCASCPVFSLSQHCVMSRAHLALPGTQAVGQEHLPVWAGRLHQRRVRWRQLWACQGCRPRGPPRGLVGPESKCAGTPRTTRPPWDHLPRVRRPRDGRCGPTHTVRATALSIRARSRGGRGALGKHSVLIAGAYSPLIGLTAAQMCRMACLNSLPRCWRA